MRSVIQLPTAPIGYVRVELGRPEIGVAQHLLDRTEIRAALEQVCREGMAEKVRMHTFGLEARTLGELPEDQECTRARESTALRVQEQLRPVALVEVRAAVGEVAAQRLGGLASERDDPLLAALPRAADQPLVEIDRAPLEPDRFAHA